MRTGSIVSMAAITRQRGASTSGRGLAPNGWSRWFGQFLALSLGLALVGINTQSAHADAFWTGATNQDWNTGSNWNPNPPGTQNYIINNTAGPGVFPVISANSAFTPVDILVGTGSSANTGRVDHTAGTAGTGDGNWLFLGIQGATATYNLANTAATGGAFTGFGQGSGNLNVGGALQNGSLLIGLDPGTTATLNIHTSGTLAADRVALGSNGSNGTNTVNLDSGTVNVINEFQIGGNAFNQGNGSNNILNMSGGNVTANIVTLSRGNNNLNTMDGTATITGGTLNSRLFFTLGFAGAAGAVATVTNNGGTINVNTVGPNGILEMGVFDATTNVFTVASGAVNLQNNAGIVYGSGGNHTGTSTVTQNGGTVTFYSDAGSTVGGTGSVNLGSGGSTGTYTYNLNGGTLTVPRIEKTAGGGSGTFNFNGGTLKATQSTTTFMTGLTNAFVQSGGAVIDTNTFNITIGQALLTDAVSTGGGLTKNGSGTLTLNGANTYTGPTLVNAGALGGSGAIAGPLTVAAGGTHAPGPLFGTGIQSTGAYTNNGTLAIGISGTTAGSGHDQVNVTGTVTLGGTLNVSAPTYTSTSADTFIIINNDGADAVNGTFTGLPQGSTVSSGGNTFTISYTGGDGNDVVLTVAGSAWLAIDVATDSANVSKILWRNGSTGQMSLWIVPAAGGTPTKKISFGPFAGWTVLDVAAGPAGTTQVLWQASNGYVALWRINDATATGGVADDPATSTGLSSFVYGPFGSGSTAWNAARIAVDSSGNTRLLWRRADGAMGLWTVAGDFNVTASLIFGPFATWSPVDVAVDNASGNTRVLWQGTDQSIALWSVSAAGAVNSVNYGPYPGWSTTRIAVGGDNNTRIAWQRADGSLGLWTVDPAGALVNSFIYGPYPGWNVTDVGAGADNNSRVLWNKADGTVSLWIVTPSGGVSSFTYGPGPL